MATIVPFRAIRPTSDKVAAVVSKSYNAYTTAERKLHMNTFPDSFLHLIAPYHPTHKVPLEMLYPTIRARFLSKIAQGIFIQEDSPSYYIYKITEQHTTFFGVIALASTADYACNRIKKHEDTLQKREIAFEKYLQEVRFHAEPVVLTYPDCPKITALFLEIMRQQTTYAFTTPDAQYHELWAVKDPELISKIGTAFGTIETLYIADGHHRCASSYRVSKTKTNHTQAFNFFMSYLIPESHLHITTFSRLVKDLNGHTVLDFLARLEVFFNITMHNSTPFYPNRPREFSMYLEGNYYQLQLKSEYKTQYEVALIDTQILYDIILKPILGIQNMRNDPRLYYLHSPPRSTIMQQYMDKNTMAIGFDFYPVCSTDLRTVADLGLTMPPKSTYIQPKLKSGLLLYAF